MEVVFVSSVILSDKTEARASGIGIYVQELTKELTKRDIPVLQVTDTSPADHTKIKSDSGSGLKEQSVTVFPVAKKSSRSNLGFLLKLVLKMPSLKFEKDIIIHAQRPEMLLPFILLKSKNPRICTLHGSQYTSVAMKHSTLYSALYRKLERYCLKNSAKIIAVDKMTGNEYKERYPILTDKITVIPTGLDLKKFIISPGGPLRTKYKLPKKSRVILFVGRLEVEKQLDKLINAFGELSQKNKSAANPLILWLVGSGSLRSKLEKQAAAVEPNNIRFMGAVTHETVPEVMNCADIFVLCSAFEGSPTVVKESLACGVPVVASNVGNIPELVVPDRTGELISPDATPKELSSAIQKVLTAIENKSITPEGCRKMVKPFGVEVIADKIVGIYNEVR